MIKTLIIFFAINLLSLWNTVPQNLYFWKTSKVTGCIRCSLRKIYDRKNCREKKISLELRFQPKVILEPEVRQHTPVVRVCGKGHDFTAVRGRHRLKEGAKEACFSKEQFLSPTSVNESQASPVLFTPRWDNVFKL